MTEKQVEKIQSCLTGLPTVTDKLKLILDAGMAALRTSTVKPRKHIALGTSQFCLTWLAYLCSTLVKSIAEYLVDGSKPTSTLRHILTVKPIDKKEI